MSEDSWRGKVGALARDEVDEFLAEGRIARLGCLDADGWPYVVPVWHEWDGSAFWVVARRRSICRRSNSGKPPAVAAMRLCAMRDGDKNVASLRGTGIMLRAPQR